MSERRDTPTWQTAAARRRREIDSKIPESYRVPRSLLRSQNSINVPYKCGVMTARELCITETRAVDLLEGLRSKRYTALEVTAAFCKRAAIAHQMTNCLAVVLFNEALRDAADLDRYMQRHGKPKGALHGLPVSVKEHIHLQGTVAASGLVAWADSMSPGDALIVKVIREAGAVFHVKTTNPQTLMALETDSNLFGRTTNPYNRNLTPGGSSGGEAALVAMRGSPLGIGSDIGGSIRVPSAFSGGYGLKPSVARIPHSGMSGIHSGMENIIGCVGPMANCIEDLQLFCEVALASRPWEYEPSLIPIPWKTMTPPKMLTIGVMWNDGIVMPHPPVQRALRDAVLTLRRNGFDTVDWEPKHHADLVKWINRAYLLDGGNEYRRTIEEGRESPVPILEWFLGLAGPPCSIEETWRVNAERDRLRTLYATQWRQSGIDVLLCPANASVASAHEESHYWGYSSVFNALDLSAAVLPVDKVTCTDVWDQKVATDAPWSSIDREYRAMYNPEKYKDAPISLQLVAGRLQEERLLTAMQTIDSLLKEDKARQKARSCSMGNATSKKTASLATVETREVVT